MTRRTISIFVDEIYSKPPKKNDNTNKTDVYQFDDIWSLHILDSKDYGHENLKGYGYILVVIDNLSNYGFSLEVKILKH